MGKNPKDEINGRKMLMLIVTQHESRVVESLTSINGPMITVRSNDEIDELMTYQQKKQTKTIIKIKLMVLFA